MCVIWQAYQYWWGLQIQRILSQHSYARRVEMFPAAWKAKLGAGYFEPMEPITAITWRGDSVQDLRRLMWLPFLQTFEVIKMNSYEWNALAEFRQITTLSVAGSVPDAGFVSIGKLDRLRNLSLWVSPDTATSSIQQIASLPRLEKLHWRFADSRFSNRTNRAVKAVRPRLYEPMMRELAKSRSLAWLKMPWLNDGELLALTEQSSDAEFPLVNLTELRLDESLISDAGLNNLHHVPNLIHLDLSHSNVSDEGLTFLKSIRRMRTLYLSGCQGITDQGAERLAELSSLESLNVKETQLTKAGVIKLGFLRRLRSFRIGNEHVHPELRQVLPPTCKINTY